MEKDATPELTGPLPPRAYLRRCAQEPYRILFPLGAVFGFLGVAVWPLAAMSWSSAPPTQSHARLMVEGMAGTFLVGFLATALPRLLGVEPLSGNLVVVLAVTFLSSSMFDLLGGLWLGDLLFIFALLLPLVAFTMRFRHRKANPPPSFVLLLLGLVGGAAGAFLQAEKAMGRHNSPCVEQLSFLLLYQGFPLLPLLGAAAFFAPRIFGGETPEDGPPSLRPSREWTARALLALGAGLLIFGSFLIEARGMRRLGELLRAATAAGYLALSLPRCRELLGRGTVVAAIRMALLFSLLGLLIAPFFPPGRAGSLHLFFLGGVGLMVLAIGAQSVYGLSGRGFLLRFRFIPFEFAIGGVVAALVARIAADHFPSSRPLLLFVSALLWIGALALWSFAVLPFVLCPDVEEESGTKETKEGQGG